MFYVPVNRNSRLEDNIAGASTGEFGVSVASNNTQHYKGTYVELIASSAYAAYGITVYLGNVAAAGTNTSMLVDIAIGAASSERVIIPNLIASSASDSASSSGNPYYYYFPIYIPAGTRISARSQTGKNPAPDTVHVAVHLHQGVVPGKWYGSRVTAYGVNDSVGVATQGTDLLTFDVDYLLTSATTNPIKYMQVGLDIGPGNAGTVTNSYSVKIRGSSGVDLTPPLPVRNSTTLETVDVLMANFMLSHMNFNLPAGIPLYAKMDSDLGGASQSAAVYGVD